MRNKKRESARQIEKLNGKLPDHFLFILKKGGISKSLKINNRNDSGI